MSSNPLYGLRKVGIFVQLTGLPGRTVRQPVFAGCTRRLCDRRLWLVTKSALEVYVVHDDALYKLTIFKGEKGEGERGRGKGKGKWKGRKKG